MWLLLGPVEFTKLLELLVDHVRPIRPMSAFVILDEAFHEVEEVVVETPYFVLHVFLELDPAHLGLVDETLKDGTPVRFLVDLMLDLKVTCVGFGIPQFQQLGSRVVIQGFHVRVRAKERLQQPLENSLSRRDALAIEEDSSNQRLEDVTEDLEAVFIERLDLKTGELLLTQLVSL